MIVRLRFKVTLSFFFFCILINSYLRNYKQFNCLNNNKPQTFNIPLFTNIQGRVNKHLEEGQIKVLVYAPGHGSVLLEGRNKTAQANNPSVGEEFRNLGYSPNVLLPVLRCKAQIVVQTGAHVVAVQTVTGDTRVDQEGLDVEGDGSFAGTRESREPDGAPAKSAHRTQGATSLHPGYVVSLERDVRARLR